ncbi:hypothetical protein DY000_02033975 [Brassica cretica]|uniref:Prenyltransferase alpha-alpha toroid domain-containing protein n=1 Tax=Brassica cretica TaxID=69181 RepID=A0ABQ7DZ60_BRACR|nr:hypothetical protein DY000_02033975 [Brassica cretica]
MNFTKTRKGKSEICGSNENRVEKNESQELTCSDTMKEGANFDSLNLQRYVILCSMVPRGGFRDKPGKPRDFYHTCYCLSGLSVAQHA